MFTIYKYPIDLIEAPSVMMPENAKVVHFAVQNNQLCIWAQVSTMRAVVRHNFYIVGTGHEIPETSGSYIGTVLDGGFVWHLYEGPDA